MMAAKPTRKKINATIQTYRKFFFFKNVDVVRVPKRLVTFTEYRAIALPSSLSQNTLRGKVEEMASECRHVQYFLNSIRAYER